MLELINHIKTYFNIIRVILSKSFAKLIFIAIFADIEINLQIYGTKYDIANNIC